MIGIGIGVGCAAGGAVILPPEPTQFIINGPFTTDTVWVKGAGWTISAGVSSNSGTLGLLTETMAAGLRIGNTYPFSMDIVSNTQSVNIEVRVGAQSIYQGAPVAGTISFSFVSTTSSDQIRFQDEFGDGIAGLSIDNVSLVPA